MSSAVWRLPRPAPPTFSHYGRNTIRLVVRNEGCLSFPGVREEIKRAEHVKVRALDRSGKPFELEAHGLLAVAIQHETDHLNGVLMVDKLNALKRRMMGRRLAQARKEAENSAE